MSTYKTFTRSFSTIKPNSFGQKRTVETGLTYSQAQERCEQYNNNRTAAQKRKGTMLEFTAE